LLAAAAVLTPSLLRDRGWLPVAAAAQFDLVHDTLNGLVAFVVPGPDSYSMHQGVSTPEPGGMAAEITDVLIGTLDGLQPAPPPFSAVVTTILNQVALAINPAATGPFSSPFARLSFQEKVAVFAYLEADPALAPLGGALPGLAAFHSYSEAGVFDAQTRTLTGRPIGWEISSYDGVADGRDEFKGYFQNRRSVQ